MCDDLIVQSGVSPTLQKAELANILEMILRSGMNRARHLDGVIKNHPCPDRDTRVVLSENRGKTIGIPGKRKKSEKSAFLGWTASEVPLINRAHHHSKR